MFISNNTFRQPGAGRPHKYKDLEDFIVNTVKQAWESGAPMTPEQLHYAVLRHCKAMVMVEEQYFDIIDGNRNSLNRYVQRVLERNKFSVRKISISQSIPSDWRSKAEANAAWIRKMFS